MAKSPVLVLLCLVVLASCNNYDLSARLENPGGSAKTAGTISVVSTNITNTLNTGGTFSATVTFNRAVNIPNGSITISNGAGIANVSTADNITWTFDITGLTNNTYAVMFSSAISDSTGATLVPFSVTFTHTLV